MYWAASCFRLLDNGIRFPPNQKHIAVLARQRHTKLFLSGKNFSIFFLPHLLSYACVQIPKVQFARGLCKWKWKRFPFELGSFFFFFYQCFFLDAVIEKASETSSQILRRFDNWVLWKCYILRQASSSHHQIVIWICFWFCIKKKSESTETAMLSIASMKSYRGMCTIQLQYIKFNFHFCPTCLKALCYAENSLSRSRVKVKVVWWWWGNIAAKTCELYINFSETRSRFL